MDLAVHLEDVSPEEMQRRMAAHGKEIGVNDEQVSYKPDGYQSVIPYLHATGARNLIAFMKEVFDAQEIAIYPRPDGTVGHAALRIGDSVIELADAGPEWPAMPCALQVYVPDTDAAYHRALKAGANSIIEPADQFYGDRTASVRDSSGNNWYIATQVEVIAGKKWTSALPPCPASTEFIVFASAQPRFAAGLAFCSGPGTLTVQSIQRVLLANPVVFRSAV